MPISRSLQEIVQPLLRHLTVLLLCAWLGVGQAVAGSMTLLGVGGPAAATGLPLDGITTGIKAAYSTRKLLTAYAGNAIQVQRISDSTNQNIGFVANVLDTTSLATFCSGTTCKVITWYDQSGGGFDQTDQTIGTSPIIYQSGAVNAINTKPAVLFVSASSTLLQNTSMTGNPVNTLFQNAVISFSNASQAITSANGAGGLEWRIDATTGDLELLSAFTASLGTSTSGITFGVGAVVESQYNSSTGAWSFWINRAAAGTGTQTATLTARTSTIGALEPPNGSIGEIIMYDLVGGIPSGSRTSIENNQQTYWGTP